MGLRRSRSDRVFAGVCGGIAEYLNVSSKIVRIITFLLFWPGGLSFWIYVFAAIAIPIEEY